MTDDASGSDGPPASATPPEDAEATPAAPDRTASAGSPPRNRPGSRATSVVAAKAATKAATSSAAAAKTAAPAKKTAKKSASARTAAQRATTTRSASTRPAATKAAPEKSAPSKGAPARPAATKPAATKPAARKTATPPAEAPQEAPTAPDSGARRRTRGRRPDPTISIPTTAPITSSGHDPRRAAQRVAVIIPAKDEVRRIAQTVRAAMAIPQVDLVLVVDDGSADGTQHVARDAGAVVVRHSHNRGKAAAMETGAAVVAMRDAPGRLPRLLLFIDADLAETAVNTAPLVPPIAERAADMAIALLPPQAGARGRGFVVKAARRAIAQLTGWTPTQPLSGMRCLTREAFEAATPLARGWGVETGMTIDLLRQGFVAVEVPCDLRHRPTGNDLRGQLHRAAQYRDVMLAATARRARSAAGVVTRSGRP